MNLLLALGAWIGVSVPVSLALGILLGHAKGTPQHHHQPVTAHAGRLTRV